MLHTDPGIHLTIGRDVTVGHMVMLHGCKIGDGSLIGIGSIVLNNAVIGRNSLVGANTLIPEGKVFPERVLIVGSPGKVIRELSDEEVARLPGSAQRYVQNWQPLSARGGRDLSRQGSWQTTSCLRAIHGMENVREPWPGQ